MASVYRPKNCVIIMWQCRFSFITRLVLAAASVVDPAGVGGMGLVMQVVLQIV
jgi:hypothetical protein